VKPDDARAFRAKLQADPVWAAEKLLGVRLWSKQREILRSVWENEATAVRSGHGVGKTFTAAIAGITFQHVFPNSLVITTAPSWTQVETLLWKEWHKAHTGALVPLGSRMTTTTCEITPNWRAWGISTDNPDRLVGQHAEHLLVIVDEAFGVKPWVMEAVETWMTGGAKVRLLCIGNPTDPTSALARAWKQDRAMWSTLHVSAFDSPAVSVMPYDGIGERLTPADLDALGVSSDLYGRVADSFRLKTPSEREDVSDEARCLLTGDAWIFRRAIRYGIGSPLWQCRVLGDFPDSREDTVLSVKAIEEAQARDLDTPKQTRITYACDVARFGNDETTIASKCGNVVRLEHVFQGQDLMATSGWLYRMWLESGRKARIVVDVIGMGSGVCDRLRELGVPVEEFNAASNAIDGDLYPNARSEMWFRARDLIDELDLDGDEQLASDLTAPRYKMNSKGQLVVESKDETKKRIGRSPDRADAVLMAMVPEAGTLNRGSIGGW